MARLTVAFSYVLSRVAFVATHVVFAYWLNFILNDPLDLGLVTLDAKPPLPAGQCERFSVANATSNVLWFALWWGSHSILARKSVKLALGLWEHPIERPVFATVAWVAWGLNVHYWRPVDTCAAPWAPLDVSPWVWAAAGTVFVAGVALIVGLLWSLPDHVFGTARYQYEQGKRPHGDLILSFPYGLVRHPAAAGFLWCYAVLPAWTANHLFLAGLWITFILVATRFEEGGLTGDDEFGQRYGAYRRSVAAFHPTWAAIKNILNIAPLEIKASSSETPGQAKKKKQP
jgi:protein-S-isoprenylcysteine O-methyltransferase Ste14